MKLQGASHAAAAAAVGLERSTVAQIWTSPESRALVAQARVRHSEEISRIFGQILQTLSEDLTAAKSITERTKLREHAYAVILRGEPDLAQQTQEQTGQSGEVFWQDVLIAIRGQSKPPTGVE